MTREKKIPGVKKLLACLPAISTPLHTAALHGDLRGLTSLLELGADPNSRNATDGKTPLMIACKRGHSACVKKLLEHGANALAFDPAKGRTCLHLACRGGHYECVVDVLDNARNGTISTTWGFERFVNVLDNEGAVPLHMAARSGNARVVSLLLDNGGLVTAVTFKSTYGPRNGSTPLHFAARGGSLDCVEELLAWGADRTHKDMMGHTAYAVARRRGNARCAEILDPSAAEEPLVWPSPLPFIRSLEPETRAVLREALSGANRKRRVSALSVDPVSLHSGRRFVCLAAVTVAVVRRLSLSQPNLGVVCDNDPPEPTSPSLPPSSNQRQRQRQRPQLQLQLQSQLQPQQFVENPRQMSSRRPEFDCTICFEAPCPDRTMIRIGPCGHHMCAPCTIALCCHSKPDPAAASSSSSLPPSCPFCRRNISKLSVAKLGHSAAED